MAKAKPPEEVTLDALRRAMKELPNLLPLSGTGALFTTKQAEIAKRAVAEGLLTTHKKQVKSGRTTKLVEVAILTEAGARKVASATGTEHLKDTLEALKSAVEKIGKPPAPPDPAQFRLTVETATATCVDAISSAFAELRGAVLQAVAPTGSSAIDPAPILVAITTALGNIKPVEVKIAVVTESQSVTAHPAPVPVKPDALKAVADEIVSFVNVTAQERTVGCDFVELFDHLQSKHTSLTIGTFHDALRTLDAAGRIRLKDWPRMQDDIPRPELALFVSHTVMYHVQPAR